MTIEEKRKVVEAYCECHACDECAMKDLPGEAGSLSGVITEEQLDARIAAIEAEKSKTTKYAAPAAPAEKTAAQISDAITKAKADMCKELCDEHETCDSCPCSAMADYKHDGHCEFDEFSEEDLDEYLKNFAAEEETKREFTKVAPPTETSLKDAIHPQHYKLPGGMEVIDVEVAMFGREAVMAHCCCTAAEYILRHRRKNGVEDIKKAHWWLEKYIELEASK